MKQAINDYALDQLFRTSRSHYGWLDGEISEQTIHAIFDLLSMGPTSVNGLPARFLFLKSESEKQRLVPHMLGNNAEKVTTAPVCVIIAYDLHFYEKLETTFGHDPKAKAMFVKNDQLNYETAFRNSSLQGAYFMMAARAIGLDCGPISGFINEGIDAEFFPDGKVKSNFICSIGVGDESKVFDRLPRLTFDQACKIL